RMARTIKAQPTPTLLHRSGAVLVTSHGAMVRNKPLRRWMTRNERVTLRSASTPTQITTGPAMRSTLAPAEVAGARAGEIISQTPSAMAHTWNHTVFASQPFWLVALARRHGAIHLPSLRAWRRGRNVPERPPGLRPALRVAHTREILQRSQRLANTQP